MKSKALPLRYVWIIIHLPESGSLGDLYFTLITGLNCSEIRQAGWRIGEGEKKKKDKLAQNFILNRNQMWPLLKYHKLLKNL